MTGLEVSPPGKLRLTKSTWFLEQFTYDLVMAWIRVGTPVRAALALFCCF